MISVETKNGLYKAIPIVQCSENTQKNKNCSNVWHERLAHGSQDVLVDSVPHIAGIKVESFSESNGSCDACALCMTARAPQKSNLSAGLSSKPVERVYSDCVRQVTTAPLAGSEYSVASISEYKGYAVMYLMNRKGETAKTVICMIKELKIISISKMETLTCIQRTSAK